MAPFIKRKNSKLRTASTPQKPFRGLSARPVIALPDFFLPRLSDLSGACRSLHREAPVRVPADCRRNVYVVGRAAVVYRLLLERTETGNGRRLAAKPRNYLNLFMIRPLRQNLVGYLASLLAFEIRYRRPYCKRENNVQSSPRRRFISRHENAAICL